MNLDFRNKIAFRRLALQQRAAVFGAEFVAVLVAVFVLLLATVPLGSQQANAAGGLSSGVSDNTGPTGPGRAVEPPSLPGSRDGSAFEPLGIRLGGFLLNPFVDVEVLRDDNIFARSDVIESDTITVVRPGFNLNSLWSNHALKIHGDTALGRYSDFDTEDYDNWLLSAEGRIDVDRDRHLTLGVALESEKEDRASPDAIVGSRLPTETDTTRFSASWWHTFNRLYYRLGGGTKDLEFDNSDTDVNDRDRTLNALFAELGYEFSPGYSAFVRLETEDTDYDTLSRGRNRDSSGESLIAGVNFDLPDIIEGALFAGYRDRSFDDPALEDISGGLVGASLTWQVTGLTSLDFDANRTIEETTVQGASGYYRTRFGVVAEHELYRNLILDAGIGFYDDDYEGADRKDDGFNWHIGGTYLSNRWLRLQVEYAHEDRDSSAEDVITSDYDRDVFRIFVRGIR